MANASVERRSQLLEALVVKRAMLKVSNKHAANSTGKLPADLSIDLGILFTRIPDQYHFAAGHALKQFCNCDRLALPSHDYTFKQLVPKTKVSQVQSADRKTMIGLQAL